MANLCAKIGRFLRIERVRSKNFAGGFAPDFNATELLRAQSVSATSVHRIIAPLDC